MSPDRIIMTRAEAIRRRKEEEQKQREKLAQKKVAIPVIKPAPQQEHKPAPLPKPVIMGSMGIPAAKAKPRSATISRPTGHMWHGNPGFARSRKYQSLATAPEPSAPVFNAPRALSITISKPKIGFGPRVISFFIVLFCILDLYCMLNYDPFIAHNAEITGNSQISQQEIQNVLGIDNIPAAVLNPAQVQINILAAYPNISSAQVDVNFPGNVVVTVVERTPVAAWQQNGQTVWLDAQGYGFPPHGQVDNLPSIAALGAPPAIAAGMDPAQTIGARPFLSNDMTQLMITLLTNQPKGTQLVFDPQYGIGWNDPQGWKVFFGQSNQNAALKIQVYQSMLAYIQKNNIKPTLISVEYPNAPFYQMAQ